MFPSYLSSIALSLILFFGSFAAHARFYPSDAEEVDREDLLNGSYYLDILAYDYPTHWYSKFDDAQAGYRVQSGGLNPSRFYFLEDIKFDSSKTPSPVDFHFRQRRQEDLLGRDLKQELRIQWNGLGNFYLAPLADASGGTYKKWDSLGIAAGFKQDANSVELYYWDVDFLYNSKEQDPLDHINKSINTLGGKLQWTLWQDGSIGGSVELDSPLYWVRGSEGYEYSYLKETQSVQVRSPHWGDIYVQLEFLNELKKESKSFSADSYKKALKRNAKMFKLSIVGDFNDLQQRLNLELIQRKADYSYGNVSLAPTHSTEGFSPDIKRNEWLVGYTLDHAAGSNLRFQWGLFHSYAVIKELPKDIRENHTKLQGSMELSISDRAFGLFNSVWALDRLSRPFSGGELAFMVVL